MEQDINNNELRKRQTYVPASVKVIEITTQRVVCSSPGGDTEDLGETPFKNW